MNTHLKRLQKEFDYQTGGDFLLSQEYATLLYENENVWLILYQDDNNVLNIVYKDKNKRMECIEI